MVHLIFHSFLDNWPKVPIITAQRCSERTMCSSLPFVRAMTDGETGQNRATKSFDPTQALEFSVTPGNKSRKHESEIK